MPVTLIGEAVFARCLSALKLERVSASKLLKGPSDVFRGDKKEFIEDIRKVTFEFSSRKGNTNGDRSI
jgi:6-phosphogluconate dehydrogenase